MLVRVHASFFAVVHCNLNGCDVLSEDAGTQSVFSCAETFSSTLTSEQENSGMGGIAMLTLSDTENNLHFILILQGLIRHRQRGERGERGCKEVRERNTSRHYSSCRAKDERKLNRTRSYVTNQIISVRQFLSIALSGFNPIKSWHLEKGNAVLITDINEKNCLSLSPQSPLWCRSESSLCTANTS